MSFGSHSWAGHWGSQFFGKDTAEIPLSVVGAFGAAAGARVEYNELDPTVAFRAFVGAFGAYRTACEDTPQPPPVPGRVLTPRIRDSHSP